MTMVKPVKKEKKALTVMFNDCHLKEDNIELILSLVDQCINLCINKKVKFAIFNGDFFDTRESNKLHILLVFKDVIRRFKKAGILLYATAGNHEKVALDEEISYLSLFEEIIGFKLYSKEGFEIIDGVCYCFLSFFPEQEYLQRLVNLIESIQDIDLPKILFTHQAIEGVLNNDRTKVENDISVNFFDVFKQVFVAHYHSAQTIAHNIRYNGSSHQQNFGDMDEKRGFTVLYEDFSFKLHKSIYPEFIHIKTPATDKERLKEVFEQYKDTTDNVKITLTGTKDEVDSVQKSMYLDSKIDVRYEDTSNLIIGTSMQEISDSTTFDKKSLLQHWLRYASLQSMESKLRANGLQLLKQL